MKRLPLTTIGLVLANLAAYVWERASIAAGDDPCSTLGVVPEHLLPSGNVAPFLTHAFLHDPSAPFVHLGGNMAALSLIGVLVERAIGHARFAVLYLVGGVLGALSHVAVDPHASAALVGSSGCISGLLAVLAVVQPRLLGFAVGFMLVNIWWAWTGTSGIISFASHIGGFTAGAILVLIAWTRGSVDVWRSGAA